MTPRLTNATMLVLPWDAGACASMHSVLLSTQVSYTRNHTVPGRFEQCITSFSGLTLHLFVMLVSLGYPCSHIGETGGAFLSPHSIFFRLPGVWFRHGPGHTIDQPLRGTFPLCHLRGAVLLTMHAALLSAV